jgi:hypothetical protein
MPVLIILLNIKVVSKLQTLLQWIAWEAIFSSYVFDVRNQLKLPSANWRIFSDRGVSQRRWESNDLDLLIRWTSFEYFPVVCLIFLSCLGLMVGEDGSLPFLSIIHYIHYISFFQDPIFDWSRVSLSQFHIQGERLIGSEWRIYALSINRVIMVGHCRQKSWGPIPVGEEGS